MKAATCRHGHCPLPTSAHASSLAADHVHVMASMLPRPHCPFQAPVPDLIVLLRGILLVDGVGAGGCALLVKLGAHRAMKLLLEDRLGFNGFELGLEVTSGIRAGVASTTSIGHVIAHILNFFTGLTPIDVQWSVQKNEHRRCTLT